MADIDREEGVSALERLVFFSDAVMAIAITLLALDLRLPPAEGLTNETFLQLLGDLAPQYIAFVISFIVIGSYWLAHHRAFRYIVRYDSGLLGLNMLFLFLVIQLPFLTSLLGQHGNLPVATALYALGLSLMGFTSTALWVYSVRNGLVSDELTPELARFLTLRGLVVPAVFLASIPLSFISPIAVQIAWIAAALSQSVLTRRLRPREDDA
jgi:uncharacterized membrane protein